MRRCLFVGLAVACSLDIRAQEPESLFVELALSRAAISTSTVATGAGGVDGSRVGMRLEHLFGEATGPASRVRLNVNEHSWIAQFHHLDHDQSGFRSWVGTIEGVEHSHVVFTEREGVVSGLIHALGSIYQIRTIEPHVFVVHEVDETRLARELDPLSAPSIAASSTSRLASAARDDTTIVDVLLLYTPIARAHAGGPKQIQAVASQVISDSNTIFSRSGMTIRFRLAGATEIDMSETTSMEGNLAVVTNLRDARFLRDAAKADLVQLLVSSPDAELCGYSWLLSTLADDFDAYSVADIACLPTFTPTHEMAHSMGSHHAPEDGATGALFPYSYGFKDAGRQFRTVMALRCPDVDCPRIPNFSTSFAPDGRATGSDTQDNARSIDEALATVANWRQSGAMLAPLEPVNLLSEVHGGTVVLLWSRRTDVPLASPASAYTLQVGTSPGSSDVFNASVGSLERVTGTIGAGTFFWRVIASNSAGISAPSAEQQFVVSAECRAPGRPEQFTFALSGRVVTLQWAAPLTGDPPAFYSIEAGSAPGLSNLYDASTGSSAPTAVVPAPPGTYYVRIRARNACGIGAPSIERAITVP